MCTVIHKGEQHTFEHLPIVQATVEIPTGSAVGGEGAWAACALAPSCSVWAMRSANSWFDIRILDQPGRSVQIGGNNDPESPECHPKQRTIGTGCNIPEAAVLLLCDNHSRSVRAWL